MSLEINLENFPNWPSVFEKIEGNFKVGKLNRQERMEGKPRTFTTADPEVPNIEQQERKPRSSIMIEGETRSLTAVDPEAGEMYKSKRKPGTTVLKPGQSTCYKPRRCSSDTTGSYMLKVTQPRFRIPSAPPCLPIDRVKLLSDTRLTEAAKKLSDEELALLYHDILKPVDFYAMLHERRKQL